VSHGIRWTCISYELLLLAKAVTVAVLGQEQLLPPPPGCEGTACGRVGLLCLYTSIVAGLLTSFAENWLGRRLVAARRKRHEAAEAAAGVASGVRQPLLAKGKAKQVSAPALRSAGGNGCSSVTTYATLAPVEQMAGSARTEQGPHHLCSCLHLQLQEAESATIPELIRLSLPDSHILLLAFTAGAAAALGQVGWREAGRGRCCALGLRVCCLVATCHAF